MGWIVARTHQNCDKMAITNLGRQEFNYYQPKILEKKIQRNKLIHIEQSLFPCYLFVEMIDNRWRSLEYTYGIADLLGPVRDDIIVDLRNREQNGFIQLPKLSKFKEGDQVKINNGMFVGQTALVERMPTRDRQKVLLALLANQITALVDENDLEAA